MITMEQAKTMFANMIAESQKKYEIFEMWLIELDEPLYVMTVIDEEGNQHLPGDPFPSIRQVDGKFVDYSFSCPA